MIMHIYAYLIDALAEIHAPSQTTLTLMITQLRCTILETSLYAFPVLLLACNNRLEPELFLLSSTCGYS